MPNDASPTGSSSSSKSGKGSGRRQSRAGVPVLSQSTAASAVLAPAALSNLQRIPLTSDPISTTANATIDPQLLQLRQNAVSKVFLGLQNVQATMGLLAGVLANPLLPTQLVGTLAQPDGTPAGSVQIQFLPSSVGSKAPPVSVLTDTFGHFTLPLPQGLSATGDSIALQVHGASANATVQVAVKDIAANGLLPTIPLRDHMNPLPQSILASLASLLSSSGATGSAQQQAPSTTTMPTVTLGEDGDCQLSFAGNTSVDRYPYSVFYRLVEPQVSIASVVHRFPFDNGLFGFLPVYLNQGGAPGGTVSSFVDRVPIEQPISVDGFRDQIMGLQPDGTITAAETVPMAGTLGLGYIVKLAQQWTMKGIALGDLVYSLPLAPGEQQQVAVFERRDTSGVFESEFFSESEARQESALADTSTNATFNSAFSEVADGSSSFQTHGSSSSVGGSFFGLISGGGGSSSSSGNSSEHLSGNRQSTQSASERTHSAAQNQASARRSAARTGMRLATASESASVTTKTVTNHNHTRALTMQYWEVQRLYHVSTALEGVTITCLVPLQIVRFLPPGQPFTLADTTVMQTRAGVLARYDSLLRHADAIERFLPRTYQYGLQLLRHFASDPTAEVEAAGGPAEDIINFLVGGTFLQGETITVTAVTRRNTRVGPVTLTGTVAQVPAETFTSQDDLMGSLRHQRNNGLSFLTGAMALPSTMNRSDVVGFELRRYFQQIDYRLISPQTQLARSLQALGAALGDSTTGALAQHPTPTVTVTLTPSVLEAQLGGPQISTFLASTKEELVGTGPKGPTGGPHAGAETYASLGFLGILPPEPFPVPAQQIAPILRYNEILEIEKMAQHVVRSTVRYSQAVWISLTAEERAIMLEGYTIGVPPNGIADATQMIPLLNSVENRVLGFFGNSMIMPFTLPSVFGNNDQPRLSTGEIEAALANFHQIGFNPPQSTVALPTRGVLGEAVLGHCASAEKIDLTRFWNWQDSPSDTAPAISPVTLPTTSGSISAPLTAPNSLTTLTPLINNILSAPSPDSALLQALAKTSIQPDFSTGLTGAAQLAPLLGQTLSTAESARADALKTSKDLQAQALATAGNIVGGIYGGNPTAGSSALAAQNGKTPDEGSAKKDAGSGAKPGGPSGSGAGSGDAGAGGGTETGTGSTETGTGGTGGGG